MIERIIILENIDPIVFYGINNCNIQLIKTLFPKLRFTARGMVIKGIGDENEKAIFVKAYKICRFGLTTFPIIILLFPAPALK